MSARQSTKVACVCRSCQCVFHMFRCHVGQGKGIYCSRKCYRSGHEKVPRICVGCGSSFLANQCDIRLNQAKFCSMRCRRATTTPLIDRFFKYVGRKLPNGCIPWVGANSNGYGVIGIGRGSGNVQATKVSFEFFVGPVPDGLEVLHRCDNPPCINPVHLFVGTMADNMKDKMAKCRQARGETVGSAVLTEENARTLRSRYEHGDATVQELADEYGVTRHAIWLTIRRKNWKHVI